MSAVQDSAELRPCPFCGTTGSLRSDMTGDHTFDVTCWDCQSGSAISFGPEASSPDAAITAWNTRADTPLREQRDELLEALSRAPIPGRGEEMMAFRDRQDEWMRDWYAPAIAKARA